MATDSDIESANARNSAQPAYKLAQIILKRVVTLKGSVVAQAVGRDDSYVSRVLSGETGVKLDDLQRFLDAVGMKAVDKNQVCVARDIHISYKTLAMKYMELQGERSIQEDWDE